MTEFLFASLHFRARLTEEVGMVAWFHAIGVENLERPFIPLAVGVRDVLSVSS
jgi:hypothetical protein